MPLIYNLNINAALFLVELNNSCYRDHSIRVISPNLVEVKNERFIATITSGIINYLDEIRNRLCTVELKNLYGIPITRY